MKRRFMKFAFTLVCSSIFFAVNAQKTVIPQIHSFTAKEAVDYALQNAVQVKNALIDIQLQAQQNKQITAQALPQINGSVAFTDYLAIPTQLVPAEFAGGPAGTFFPIKF